MGVPIIRIMAFNGLFWGALIVGNYQINKDTEDNVESCRRDITPTVENQMEKNLENDMEPGIIYTMPSLEIFLKIQIPFCEALQSL